MTARLLFFGAAREVTGSMHLIEANGHTVALDCGIFQGRRSEADQKNRAFPCEPAKIDAVVLSHAHIDHCGKLPRLVQGGFAGIIHTTPATRDLAEIMLADSAKIQEEDTAYINKKRARRGEPPIQPLYGVEDVQRTIPLLRPHPMRQAFEVVPGVRATYHEAGHMLGSAGVSVEIDTGNARPTCITFTGDLGRANLPILQDPAPLPACDYLISESTYGGRMTEPPEDMKLKLAQVLNETFARGGKVIVPAFAVGRTQMVVYYYHQLYRDRLISKRAPLVVDSPLASRATEIYRRHPETFDPEAAEFNDVTGGMLTCKTCEYTHNVEESKALHNRKGPLIIVSASGMCEAGRIQHHLKNNIGDARNTILIVGFQAMNTLGRQLVEKFKRVKIFGDMYDVKARVAVLNGFSSHANAQELMHFIGPLAGRCKQAFLVHGEPDQAEALAAAMNRSGFDNVAIPESGATFDIG